MMYNGFESKEQWRNWLKGQWAKDRAESVLAQLAHGWCDHASGKCREVSA